ncbi:DUF4340 domain-containing protein [Catenovulum sp. SM1970]|uniref:DUF4340 domain-containing protein n=1 Tax=Marinifaba aquimaris TaxID=2741323 RepID=UPI001574A28E|nr:DUF4340 domain-containing protein [Marinifaba aquimaris]NTS77615.1 DUF4340 domain-containing protein [Marinifaba aquimaris]
MLSNKPLIFAVAGTALIAVGLGLNQGQQADSSIDKRAMLPAIQADSSTLNHIKVVEAVDELIVEAKKQNDQWVIASLDNYPADVTKIRKFINELVEAEIVEDKTSNPAKHHHLKLTPVSGEKVDSESSAVLVEVATAKEQAAVLLGGYPKNDNGRYARLNDSDQTWQVNKKIYAPGEPTSWIEKKIFENFTIADIQAVRRVTEKDGFSFNKLNPGADYVLLTELTGGQTAKDPGVMGSYASAIAGIRMQLPAKRDTQLWQQNTQNIQVGLFNGVKVDLTFAEQKVDDASQPWLSISAQAISTDEAATTLADKINQRHQNWQYNVTEYIYDSILKDLTDLVDTPSDTEVVEVN